MANERDLVQLVDEQDQPVGHLDKWQAHRHPAQLHRAVSLWLVRGHGSQRETLLQLRSPQKMTGAGWWGNALCANNLPAESAEACVRRRAWEELGMGSAVAGYTGKVQPLYSFRYQVYVNDIYGEYEFDQVFGGEYEGELQLNPEEVSAVAWVKVDELRSETERVLKDFPTAEETLAFSGTDQLKNVTKSFTFQLGGRQFQLVPWTGVMLKDERLWEWLSAG